MKKTSKILKRKPFFASSKTEDTANPVAKISAHNKLCLELSGNWTVYCLEEASRSLGLIVNESEAITNLDISRVEKLDTSGAMLINRFLQEVEGANQKPSGSTELNIKLIHQPTQQSFLAILKLCQVDSHAYLVPKKYKSILDVFEITGRATKLVLAQLLGYLNFLGCLLISIVHSLAYFWKTNWISFVSHLHSTTVTAIPIVALLSMLVGMVLAYMTATQLKLFGAEIFVVKLLEVASFREMGVLLTAIMVAGRSGSAFTAQIGAMISNRELDAMSSMGMNPICLLVVPRTLALVLAMPILTILADVMSILGGMFAVWLSMDISPAIFMSTLEREISLNNFFVGLAKAPFFGFAIASIGCYYGLQVTGSAESVGRLTTRSVVISIFCVILLDALFALFFMEVGV